MCRLRVGRPGQRHETPPTSLAPSRIRCDVSRAPRTARRWCQSMPLTQAPSTWALALALAPTSARLSMVSPSMTSTSLRVPMFVSVWTSLTSLAPPWLRGAPSLSVWMLRGQKEEGHVGTGVSKAAGPSACRGPLTTSLASVACSRSRAADAAMPSANASSVGTGHCASSLRSRAPCASTASDEVQASGNLSCVLRPKGNAATVAGGCGGPAIPLRCGAPEPGLFAGRVKVEWQVGQVP